MNSTVSCVRCGTTVPRPTDKRARCAACGTALPLFDDDPTFKVPELKPLPPSPGRLPPLPAPVGSERFTQTEILPDQMPVPEGGYEDFRLDPTDEHALKAPAGPSPGPTVAPAPPTPAPSPAVADPEERQRRRVTPIAVLSAAPRPSTPAAPGAEPRAASTSPREAGGTAAAPRASGGQSKAPDFTAARSRSGPPVALIAAVVAVLGGLGAYLLLSGPSEPKAAASAAGAGPQAKATLGDPVEPAPIVQAAPTPAAAPAPQPPAPKLGAVTPPRPAALPVAQATPAQTPAPTPAPLPPPPAATRALPPPVQRPQPIRPAAGPEARPIGQALVATAPAVSLGAPPPAPAASPPAPQPAAPAPAPAPAARVVEPPEPPRDASRKPRLAEPGCLQQALQLPRDLALSPGEVTTARFAVGLDGAAHDFSLVGAPTDRRIGPAVWSAIQKCRFIPGTDAQGQPADVWLVMPFRFDAR